MITGERKYKSRIVDILSKSFDDNPSINFIIKQDKYRKRRIRDLMSYCFEVCLERGSIFISEDQTACAFLLKSETKMKGIRQILLDAELAFKCVGLGRVFQVMRREKLINDNHPSEKFYHLWLIGVDPNEQGKGKGSAILKEVLAECDKNKRPVYLETSVKRNVSWYKHFGFNYSTEIDIGNGLWQMIRN